MRCVLLIQDEAATVYRCHRAGCQRVTAFGADAQGVAAYRAWLARERDLVLHVLVDVADEAFEAERIPALSRRERAAFAQRSAHKHLPDSPYRVTIDQGRERRGRGERWMLVAGLLRDEGVGPWLNGADELGIAVAGVASLPLVGQDLLPWLGVARAPEVLVISQQGPAAFRQSLYRHGRLAFARSFASRANANEQQADTFRAELVRIRDYLAPQRGETAPAPLQVIALVPPPLQAAIGDACGGVAMVALAFVDPAPLARRLGFSRGASSGYADDVFAGALVRRRWCPTHHYGPARLRRPFLTRRARRALWTLAGVLVGLAVTTGATTALWRQSSQQDLAAYRDRTAQIRGAYQQRIQPLAEVAADPARAQRVIEAMQRIAATRTQSPRATMAAVADVVSDHPAIELTALALRYPHSPGPDRWASGDTAAPAPRAQDGDQPGVSARLELQGRVTGFDGAAHRGQRRFAAFRRALRRHPEITDVSVEAEPFRITGAAGDTATSAHFTLAMARVAADDAD